MIDFSVFVVLSLEPGEGDLTYQVHGVFTEMQAAKDYIRAQIPDHEVILFTRHPQSVTTVLFTYRALNGVTWVLARDTLDAAVVKGTAL